MLYQQLLLWSLWILYGLLHSVLAASRVKRTLSALFGFSVLSYRLFYNFFAAGALILLIILQWRTPTVHLFSRNLPVTLLALLCMLTGVMIMAICIKGYFKQMSGVFEESKTSRLHTDGLHRFVRHPLYFGTILFLLGLGLYFPTVANLVTIFIFSTYTVIGTHYEEMKLVDQFGSAYQEYQRKVPAIFPGLKCLSK